MAEFYGIDLGTTYSCIAKINSDDIVEVIPIKKRHTTPSAVAFDNSGNLMVGQAAKHNMRNEPKDTVILIKREMSNKSYSRTIQGKTYDPVDISSFILKTLVDAANETSELLPINPTVLNVVPSNVNLLFSSIVISPFPSYIVSEANVII